VPAELPPDRDPLAGLEQHPIFRDLPPIGVKERADADALRLAQVRLRQAQQEIAALQEQLTATEQEKRHLLRVIAALQDQIATQERKSVTIDAVHKWEAYFTGELPQVKTTFNNIPLELKAFLTSTKASLQMEQGIQLTERDQVVCALLAYRMIIETYANQQLLVRRNASQTKDGLSMRWCLVLLTQLANTLATAAESHA
jgi:chromosome segregation ATPase